MHSQSQMELDAYLARMQNMPSWNIHALSGDGQTALPWYEVGPEVYRELVIDELNAPAQAAVLSSEIQKWGRLSALARRVWQVEERQYRAWRSAYYVQALDPDDKPDGWKKPTEKQIEASYRIEPEYHTWQERIERAEEAYNATDMMVHALKAKKDALMRFASKWHDAGAPATL